jgi:hypothetical protein
MEAFCRKTADVKRETANVKWLSNFEPNSEL